MPSPSRSATAGVTSTSTILLLSPVQLQCSTGEVKAGGPSKAPLQAGSNGPRGPLPYATQSRRCEPASAGTVALTQYVSFEQSSSVSQIPPPGTQRASKQIKPPWHSGSD